MGSDSGLITYGKNYINTSVFLSGDEAPYKFSIDDNNSVRYVISYPRNKEWEAYLRLKDDHVREDGYFKVVLPEVNNIKVYMLTTYNHKVTWLDSCVVFNLMALQMKIHLTVSLSM